MITHNKIISYLTNRNWVQVHENPKFRFYRAPENLGFQDEYVLPIPFNNETTDYQKFLRNNLYLISEIYEISVDELEAIINEENSIFSIRINDANTLDGKIGFSRFEELIDGLKDLLLDTATFAIYPNLVNKSKPAEAYRYLNYCKFLQTEVGSFIAKVELPSDEIIREPELFNAEVRAFNINNKLKSIISYVNNSVFDSNGQFDAEHFEDNQTNINLNILKDIERIYDKTESRNIEFYFSDLEESVKISTVNIYNENLIKLSNLIGNINDSLTEENQVTLIGRITSLKSLNPEGQSNEIVFSSLLENLPIRVKARLDSEDYQDAVDAHKLKRNIEITGILKKMKTQYKFIDIESFNVPD